MLTLKMAEITHKCGPKFNRDHMPGNEFIFVDNCFLVYKQGVGGTIQFTNGYLKEAAELVHLNNGVFISDEVQTGFGRSNFTLNFIFY